jgi:O-antigen/teichoic acid export membrane protein
MSKIKRLAGETALYGLGSIVPKGINFLLVYLHTVDMFSREEYGSVTTILAIVAFVNVIYSFGMETAYFRFATKAGADEKKIFNLAQSVVIFVSLPLTLVFLFSAPSISEFLDLNGHPEFIYWVASLMLIDAVVSIPFARLRLQKKALLFASLKIVVVAVQVLLNIYFLKFAYNPSVGIGYVFLANLFANFLYVIFFLRTLISWRPSYDKQISPQMFHYAYPVMLTGLAGMTNEMFSRLTLELWLPSGFYNGITNKAAMGIFGACYKFAVFMNLGVQAFRYAAEPFFFSNAKEKNSPELFAKVNHYFVVTCCIFLFAISVNMDVIKYFIGKEFWDGLPIVPVLLLAYLFLGIYYNISVWFKLKDQTYFGTIITVIGAFITIAANYLLIPLMGYMGSSLAAVICYFSMAAICYWLGQKRYPIPYKALSDMSYISATMALIYLAKQLHPENFIVSIVVNVFFSIGFILAVFLMERKGLRDVL